MAQSKETTEVTTPSNRADDDKPIYGVPEAASESGLSESTIHTLIYRYKYITPPKSGEYNGLPAYQLSFNDIRWLKVYAHLFGERKPKEIARLKAVFEYLQEAKKEISAILHELCTADSPHEGDEAWASSYLLGFITHHPLLREQDEDGLAQIETFFSSLLEDTVSQS